MWGRKKTRVEGSTDGEKGMVEERGEARGKLWWWGTKWGKKALVEGRKSAIRKRVKGRKRLEKMEKKR